jgi:hypothetical protein
MQTITFAGAADEVWVAGGVLPVVAGWPEPVHPAAAPLRTAARTMVTRRLGLRIAARCPTRERFANLTVEFL